MKRAGVIGHPLGHSLSPAVFQRAFEAAGIDAVYELWDTDADDLESRVRDLGNDDVLGASVTIPYKEAVVPLLDTVDDLAQAAGAVNTIANEEGRLAGYNTDIVGFTRSLREDGSFDPMGCRAVVLGAGGAARAVATALIDNGASLIMIAGRTPKRMTELVNHVRGRTKTGTTVSWAQWGEGPFLRLLPDADLVVNCTPVGTRGSATEDDALLPVDLIPRHGLVFDLVYNPEETALARAAKKVGARTVPGLGMLAYQAAEAFRMWTGQEVPVSEMLRAGREALREGTKKA